MQIGMIGLGRMGADIVRRLMRNGHECVVHDLDGSAIEALEAEGAIGARSHGELVAKLEAPRIVWIMVPVASVDRAIAELAPKLAEDDAIVDGGNTHYVHDQRRAAELAERGIHYLDCGVSGGVFGLHRGYCLMIGGDPQIVGRLAPALETLAPGVQAAPRTRGGVALGTAEHGWLHCGPAGAGHFVKMVHNGIEYGVMAAYAEGFNLLHRANVGKSAREKDAETSPLEHPERFCYDFDVAAIAELWRRGSVIGSWLLDLTAQMLAEDPALAAFSGHVSDSGEGRWTVQAAVDTGVPAHVLSAALFARFSSRGEGDFAAKLLSAMRRVFGGHLERRR